VFSEQKAEKRKEKREKRKEYCQPSTDNYQQTTKIS